MCCGRSQRGRYGTSRARRVSASQASASGRAKLGGWAFAVVLLAWIGGLIGWLDLRNDDRRRADHVLKWGLIWTILWSAFWVVIWLLLNTLEPA